MEPRVSMTAYVLFLIAAEALFAASDYSGTILVWLGIGLLAFGALSTGHLYQVTRGFVSPAHRRRLDRLVAGQWSAAGGAAVGFGVLSHTVGYRPLATAAPLVHA